MFSLQETEKKKIEEIIYSLFDSVLYVKLLPKNKFFMHDINMIYIKDYTKIIPLPTVLCNIINKYASESFMIELYIRTYDKYKYEDMPYLLTNRQKIINMTISVNKQYIDFEYYNFSYSIDINTTNNDILIENQTLFNDYKNRIIDDTGSTHNYCNNSYNNHTELLNYYMMHKHKIPNIFPIINPTSICKLTGKTRKYIQENKNSYIKFRIKDHNKMKNSVLILKTIINEIVKLNDYINYNKNKIIETRKYEYMNIESNIVMFSINELH
jgi:hypothetical protein